MHLNYRFSLVEEVPEVVKKMIGQKEGWVYMLSCLKCYLENDINDLRALCSSHLLN